MNPIPASRTDLEGSGPLDVTLVVPCYNASAVLPRTADRLTAFLGALGRSWELVFVDDGSTDDTAELLTRLADGRGDEKIRALFQSANYGKGAAVRRGMLEARGAARIFVDVDLDYDTEAIARILERLDAGSDIATASRLAEGALITLTAADVRYIHTRHVMSQVLNLLVRAAFVPGVTDSQAGLKGFSASAAERLFPLARVSGFAMDVELLYLASRLGMRIDEVAVHWRYGREASTVDFVRDSLRMGRDLLRIKLNGVLGRYPRTERSP